MAIEQYEITIKSTNGLINLREQIKEKIKELLNGTNSVRSVSVSNLIKLK